MAFKDRLLQDARLAFLSEDIAEMISYTPFGESPKLIKAVVRRDRLEPSAQDQSRLLAKQAEIWVSNHEEDGILLVTKGEDIVSMPVYEGGSPSVDWRVIEILSKDPGMWHLLVQR